MTFGQLFVELEALKKSDPKLLENDLVLRTSEGDTWLELAVTLPGRQLVFVIGVENANGE